MPMDISAARGSAGAVQAGEGGGRTHQPSPSRRCHRELEAANHLPHASRTPSWWLGAAVLDLASRL
jgi:hypothetical protein